jgi:hypothetical protein
MRPSLFCFVGIVGLAAVGCGSPASADDLKSVVRTLNAILNPEDAWRAYSQQDLLSPGTRILARSEHDAVNTTEALDAVGFHLSISSLPKDRDRHLALRSGRRR